MKCRFIIGLAIVSLSLAACQGTKKIEEANNFKPYISNEQYALPTAYPNEVWAYKQGTPTRDIINRWRSAGIIMDARNQGGLLSVETGPQFYNLSSSSQRGLAETISQIYDASHFLLIDYYRRKGVGVYTPQGLQLY